MKTLSTLFFLLIALCGHSQNFSLKTDVGGIATRNLIVELEKPFSENGAGFFRVGWLRGEGGTGGFSLKSGAIMRCGKHLKFRAEIGYARRSLPVNSDAGQLYLSEISKGGAMGIAWQMDVGKEKRWFLEPFATIGHYRTIRIGSYKIERFGKQEVHYQERTVKPGFGEMLAGHFALGESASLVAGINLGFKL